MEPFLLTIALIGGFALSVYPRYAPRKGWRVWPSLQRHGGAAASVGFASLATAVILMVVRLDWWVVLLLIPVGVLLSMLLIRTLKSTIQALAIAIIAFAWLWFLLIELRF